MGKGILHAERSSSKFRRQAPVAKKNISKKEADKVSRLKKHQKLQRQEDRELKKKQDFELRQMAKNKKNGLA